jgi:hypothetical protein
MPEPIPEGITRMHPWIHPGAWVRLSEHRYRAAHPNDRYTVLAVAAFGETAARNNADPARERAVFADLIELAAEIAAHRVSCTEGTPIVREANRRGAGRCWWCGSYPDQHVSTSDQENADA